MSVLGLKPLKDARRGAKRTNAAPTLNARHRGADNGAAVHAGLVGGPVALGYGVTRNGRNGAVVKFPDVSVAFVEAV